MQAIELKDYILLPLYLTIIYFIAYAKRNRRYSIKNPVRKYFIPALSVKLLGAISLGLVYQYYYKGGDTFQYSNNSKIVANYFSTDFSSFIDLVFKPIISTLQLRSQVNWTDTLFAYNESNYFPIRVISVLQLLTFNTYLPSAVLLAAISFTGIWKAYTVFVHIYPKLHKQFAIAFLFMPSIFFWGSGILKDTITFTALCWLFYGSYMLFILRKRLMVSIIIVTISIFVIVVVKAYIGLAFLPSLTFWIFFQYRSKIQIPFLRMMALPVLLVLIAVICYNIVNVIGSQHKDFKTNELISSAAVSNANKQVGSNSAVNIGITDNMSTLKVIEVAPLAIVTVIFRPFLWEIKTVFMGLSSLEGLYILYVLTLILMRNGVSGMFKVINRIPLVSFCLIFGLVFSFAIGFSTSNFGTLVRYKIPAIPFLMAGLFIILENGKKKKDTFYLKRIKDFDNTQRLVVSENAIENPRGTNR
jgi:hypothetical protein